MNKSMNQSMTNSVTNKDWVAAIRDLKISAYPIYSSIEGQFFTRDVFEDALKKVSRPLKEGERPDSEKQ